MQWIDSQGKLFGKLNLFDTVIYIFLLGTFVTLIVYVYFPPSVNEHKPLLFQVYYSKVPLGSLDLFHIGNELEAYNEGDQAIISAVKKLPCRESMCDIIVTYNGTLEIGPDDQYLFNGYEITPGRELHGQINDFLVYGVTYRINMTNISTIKRVIISVDDSKMVNVTGDIYDIYNQWVGNIISIEKDQSNTFNVTGIFLLDVYDGELYIQEKTVLNVNNPVGFDTQKETIKGIVLAIEDAPEDDTH